METLQDLTNQESGIVIYLETKEGIVCNWTNIAGYPRLFATGLIGLGEEIPDDVESTTYDEQEITDLLKNVKIIYNINDDDMPTGAEVYKIDDIIIIAPHDWH